MVKYDKDNRCPYAYKGNQWVGYDDYTSISEKMIFIQKMGYGGGESKVEVNRFVNFRFLSYGLDIGL